MDELSSLEQEIYEFHEINSVQFNGTSTDVEEALLSLEEKEIIELMNLFSFIDERDKFEIVLPQARLIQG